MEIDGHNIMPYHDIRYVNGKNHRSRHHYDQPYSKYLAHITRIFNPRYEQANDGPSPFEITKDNGINVRQINSQTGGVTGIVATYDNWGTQTNLPPEKDSFSLRPTGLDEIHNFARKHDYTEYMSYLSYFKEHAKASYLLDIPRDQPSLRSLAAHAHAKVTKEQSGHDIFDDAIAKLDQFPREAVDPVSMSVILNCTQYVEDVDYNEYGSGSTYVEHHELLYKNKLEFLKRYAKHNPDNVLSWLSQMDYASALMLDDPAYVKDTGIAHLTGQKEKLKDTSFSLREYVNTDERIQTLILVDNSIKAAKNPIPVGVFRLLDAIQGGMERTEAMAKAHPQLATFKNGDCIEDEFTRARHYSVTVEEIKPYRPSRPEALRKIASRRDQQSRLNGVLCTFDTNTSSIESVLANPTDIHAMRDALTTLIEISQKDEPRTPDQILVCDQVRSKISNNLTSQRRNDIS